MYVCDNTLQENLLDRHEFLKWLVEEEFIKVTDNRVLQLYLPLVLTVSQNTPSSVPPFRFLSKIILFFFYSYVPNIYEAALYILICTLKPKCWEWAWAWG